MFKLFGKRALLALTFASPITTVVAEKPEGPWKNVCWPIELEVSKKTNCAVLNGKCNSGDEVTCRFSRCEGSGTLRKCKKYDQTLIVPSTSKQLILCRDGKGIAWYAGTCDDKNMLGRGIDGTVVLVR